MEKKREIKYRIKVVFFLIVTVVAIFYSKDLYSIYREKANLMLHNKARHHLTEKASDSAKTRNLWDRGTKKQPNTWDKDSEFVTAVKPDKTEQDRLPDMKKDILENDEQKEDVSKGNTEAKTVRNEERAQNKSVIKPQLTATDHEIKVSNKTTRHKKFTLSAIMKIVNEILARLNISHSKMTIDKQVNQTNQLTHSAVGNISKEILRYNLSFVIANAVISVLSGGVVPTSRNTTLRNLLIKDYMNNTKTLKYIPQSNPSQKGQYLDKYQRINANNQPMMSQGLPKQRSNKGVRENGPMMPYRGNLQQPLSSNTQTGFKGQSQQSYRDSGPVRYINQPKQGYKNKVGQEFNQQPKQQYKGNLPYARDRQKVPNKDTLKPRQKLKANLKTKMDNLGPKQTDNLKPSKTKAEK